MQEKQADKLKGIRKGLFSLQAHLRRVPGLIFTTMLSPFRWQLRSASRMRGTIDAVHYYLQPGVTKDAALGVSLLEGAFAAFRDRSPFWHARFPMEVRHIVLMDIKDDPFYFRPDRTMFLTPWFFNDLSDSLETAALLNAASLHRIGIFAYLQRGKRGALGMNYADPLSCKFTLKLLQRESIYNDAVDIETMAEVLHGLIPLSMRVSCQDRGPKR